MTLYNYLEYMCRAMLINKAERFDVRGKRILNGKYKYYLTDEIIDREFGIYNNIHDNYPKYVISYDTFDFSQNGIIHKNIIDFLLNR